MDKSLRGVAAIVIAIIFLLAAYALCVRRFSASTTVSRTIAATKPLLSEQPGPSTAIRAKANLDALRPYDRGLPVPESMDVRMVEGANYRLLGRFDAAAHSYRAALVWGRRPEIYLNLAEVLWEDGHKEEAIAAFLRVLQFNPYMAAESDDGELLAATLARFDKTALPRLRAEVYLNLGLSLLAQNDYSGAASRIAAAAAIDPSVLTRPELMNWGETPQHQAIDALIRLKHRPDGSTPH